MTNTPILLTKTPGSIFTTLATTLPQHKNNKKWSIIYIVEGTLANPKVGIAYPGKKVRHRTPKNPKNPPRANFIHWANLLDFAVIPFKNNRKLRIKDFSFKEILIDFDKYKRNNLKFWKILTDVYQNNTSPTSFPNLPGINSEIFILTVKWIWIQEDLNYKYKWNEINCKEKYVLRKDNDTPVQGVGRNKFYAALFLLKYGPFSIEEVAKIIPLYG